MQIMIDIDEARFKDIQRIAEVQLESNHFRTAEQIIAKGVPIEQEPKTGHWIEKDGFDGDVYYDCSECGESWTTIEGTPWDNEWDFCPSCGLRMFEQESEDKERSE